MLKQILSTVCVVAIMSAGSVAMAEGDTTNNTSNTTNTVQDGGTQNNSSTSTFQDGATQNVGQGTSGNNNQDQGSLSNQANVTGGSNSNVSGSNILGGGTYNEKNDVKDYSNSHNTSSNTNIANQNGYVASVPIIASAGTCLGSVGGTLSAAGIGIGSSKTVVDEECNKRQQQQLDSNVKAQEAVTRANSVRLLNELGLAPAALSLLCQDPSIRLALKAGLEPAVYNKVCAVYEPDLVNLESLISTSQY